MDVLSGLSHELAELVETAGRSLVRVEGRRRLSASGIVWSEDGLIVTAHHALEREEQIGIGLPDGQTAAATLIGRDPTTDVALLRLKEPWSGDRSLLARAAFEGDVRVGHLVLALGRPGQNVQATLGIVSALGGTWRSPAGGRLSHYLQTDVVMYPGFSGGPLVTAAAGGALLLGLNTSALLSGVSLTVPTDSLRGIVDTLVAHGRVRRGYLGVGAQPVRLPANLAEQLDQRAGLLLVSVSTDSPAERGGLLVGDIIVAIDGEGVHHVENLQAALGGDRVGQPVAVRIVRGGQVQDLTITIGERA